jgi:uncharacterized protein
MKARPFLTAGWHSLALLNYKVPPSLLSPLVPRGTELDSWNGSIWVSVVGFLFRNTRVLGVSLPFHTDFPEVNLRFYVRRTVDGSTRRAVTFIRELVPRRAIAFVARVAYNEPYLAVPMESEAGPDRAEYRWKTGTGWTRLAIETGGGWSAIQEGSEEQFIAEHYWGYTKQRDGGMVEYEVRHPPWRVKRGRTASLAGDLSAVYGPEFARVLAAPPDSAFFAEGSPVEVFPPRRLNLPRAS